MVKRKVDHARVRAAIEAAELQTSGEIVVSISHYFWGNVERVAWRAYRRLGVANTHLHNGVLLFVVPARQRFVVLGDEAIDARVGARFWAETATAIAERIRADDLTPGILHGIATIGAQLAAHFPRMPGDVNELSDEIDVR